MAKRRARMTKSIKVVQCINSEEIMQPEPKKGAKTIYFVGDEYVGVNVDDEIQFFDKNGNEVKFIVETTRQKFLKLYDIAK